MSSIELMNNRYINLFLVAFLIFSSATFAQEEKQTPPYGRFNTDSIMLGQEINYTLRYEHANNQEVLFPDSTYNFTPFELLRKEYFPTRTENNVSVDCVVYTLSTYEIDSVYELGLPIWVENLEGTDSIFANLDGIFFKDMIPVLPDSAQLYANVEYLDVEQEFNYPYLLIFLGIVVVIFLIVIIGFGGKIREYFRRKSLEKKYISFVKNYSDHLKEDMTVANVEESTVLWKAFIASVTSVQIQAMTSKEAGRALNSTELEARLKVLDRVIYAGQGIDEAKQVLEDLKEWAKQGQDYALSNSRESFKFKSIKD
ncbi:hypothetical protein [Flammeovirga kamogawensis]|uniref:Protein BatD n=1 Tax=Flammeovirga kamogawensis TaxID=373891 RepID=A0ABX8GSP0_9BACT|nr:hypothetical protein [Flammeovirga kamogawensis]MBB6461428.1 hypothetical protein [Flammeovirga kamogawensis]QWG06323.1 hypothetical protein KM029_13405 [Flammeovirga kamogawensis]TRX68151.1 hypothetical protein EO216_08420 [Flammeovirga kamogawensis]